VPDSFAVRVQDSDGDWTDGSETLVVNVNDDGPTVGTADHGVVRNHDHDEVNPTPISITGDLDIVPGADSLASLQIDSYSFSQTFNGDVTPIPILRSSGGKEVDINSDGSGGLIGTIDSGATTVFTLEMNLDGTYTFTLEEHIDMFGRQDFLLDSGSIAGGPHFTLYLNEDTGIKMNVEGSSWMAKVTATSGGAAAKLNPSSDGVGVGNNVFDGKDADIITIDFDDENADFNTEGRDIVMGAVFGFNHFGDGGDADSDGIFWTAQWVDEGGTSQGSTDGYWYALDGVLNPDTGDLEFEIGNFNGYILDYVTLDAGTGNTDAKLHAVSPFTHIEDGVVNMSVDYTATDGDLDTDPGSFTIAISGGEGTNTLTGTDGNDVISGNGPGETLLGLIGDDVLIGNTGDDTLIGGDGSDTFRWLSTDTGDYTDTIMDFTRADSDVLDLSDLLGNVAETVGTLDGHYLDISAVGDTITVKINSSGTGTGDPGSIDQTIVFEDHDLALANTSSADFITALLGGDHLNTDGIV